MIIILNGPPGSGKNTLAEHIHSCFSGHHSYLGQRKESKIFSSPLGSFSTLSFAEPMKLANAHLFGFDYHDLNNDVDSILYQVEHDQLMKNQKRDEFGGMSWREVNILLSEKFVKKYFGRDFFGKQMVKKIHELQETGKVKNIIISDSGFEEEVKTLVDEFGIDKVVVIQLVRENCNFLGDSRKYLDLAQLGVRGYALTNEGSEQDYLLAGEKLIMNILLNNV